MFSGFSLGVTHGEHISLEFVLIKLRTSFSISFFTAFSFSTFFPEKAFFFVLT